VADDRYRRLWRELLRCMSNDAFLAEVDYGVKEIAQSKKYRDLRDQNRGRAEALRRTLAEARRMVRQSRPRRRRTKGVHSG
jgi:hypothetical protein